MDQIISAKLNINPGGVPPRIKVSQYDDNSRHIRLYLYNGATAITNSTGELSNVSKVYIRGTKPDKHGFSYEATPNTTAAVYVTATVVLQMTAVAGNVPCELVFVDANNCVLGTANFILEVEPAALEDDTDTSETVLPDIIDAARSHEEAAEAAAERAEAAAAAISAGASLGKYVSVSSNVVDTDIDLGREPALSDRILVYFSTKITDPVSLITYDDGTPVTTSLGLNMSGFYLAGNCLFELQYDAMLEANCWRLLYRDEHTAYTAGTGISISGGTIANTLPQKGNNIKGYTISTAITDGNLGTYDMDADYLILNFRANAKPGAGLKYSLTLARSSPVAIMASAVLKRPDGDLYSKQISAGETLICKSNDGGTGSEQNPIVVTVIAVCDSEMPFAFSAGRVESVSEGIIDTNIVLGREPKDGDRFILFFGQRVSNPYALKVYGRSYSEEYVFEYGGLEPPSYYDGICVLNIYRDLSGYLVYGEIETNNMDLSPTSGSHKMITSGGVYTALAGKQNDVGLSVVNGKLCITYEQ